MISKNPIVIDGYVDIKVERSPRQSCHIPEPACTLYEGHKSPHSWASELTREWSERFGFLASKHPRDSPESVDEVAYILVAERARLHDAIRQARDVLASLVRPGERYHSSYEHNAPNAGPCEMCAALTACEATLPWQP